MAVAHKDSIRMGFVLIPIGLSKTAADNDIHFNQSDKESKAGIRYKKYYSHCSKEIRSILTEALQKSLDLSRSCVLSGTA